MIRARKQFIGHLVTNIVNFVTSERHHFISGQLFQMEFAALNFTKKKITI